MITKKAEYAIIILTELASYPEGTIITSKEIAGKKNIPVNLVVQLLSTLKQSGWTTGTRGPSGGVRLSIDPETVNLRQVIELIDGPIGITRCLFSDIPCQHKTQCSLRGIWARAQQSMLSVFEDVTIRDLAEASAEDC